MLTDAHCRSEHVLSWPIILSGPATRFDTGPLLRRSESCARASYKLYNGYLGLQQSIETMANSHNLLFSPRDEATNR